MSIEVERISKRFGTYEALHEVSLRIETGELVALLDAVPALVHFPLQEAFGLVVAEGLARGLKLFGARVGGVPDIAGDVPGAELFAKDHWAGLTAAIERWVTEDHSPSTAAARLMRQRYAPEVIARRHLEIYREVLELSEK